VAQWLQLLNLSDAANKPLFTVAAGTQRLLLLARALIKNPPLLILDEPCQGLDEMQTQHFVQLVDALCERLNKTLIYVSHYENEIPSCIQQVLELQPQKQTIYTLSAAIAV